MRRLSLVGLLFLVLLNRLKVSESRYLNEVVESNRAFLGVAVPGFADDDELARLGDDFLFFFPADDVFHLLDLVFAVLELLVLVLRFFVPLKLSALHARNRTRAGAYRGSGSWPLVHDF